MCLEFQNERGRGGNHSTAPDYNPGCIVTDVVSGGGKAKVQCGKLEKCIKEIEFL